MVDAVGTTAYSYDPVGQLLSENGPWTNDTVSYTYANRLRMGLSLLQPNTSPWTESYGYDSSRRLTSLTSAAGTFGYTYSPVQMERVVGLSVGDGANIANTYDSVARLTGTYLHDSGGSLLDQYAYGYNLAGQRTNVVRTAGDHVQYAYDNIGELTTANGFELSGASRLQEQLGYAYDAAGNLNLRTNNALIQNFNVNRLNELTNVLRSGTLTVAGTTSSGATNVTVNTSNAVLYADHTFASTNFTLVNGTNTFTAIAKDFLGNVATNIATNNLPVTNSYSYDLNGNVLTNVGHVSDTRLAISIEHIGGFTHGLGSRRNGSTKRGVNIGNIKVKHRRSGLPLVLRVANQNKRVAEAHLRIEHRAIRSGTVAPGGTIPEQLVEIIGRNTQTPGKLSGDI
jgi:hypothetical protein